jgi:GTP cyclohydrolase I
MSDATKQMSAHVREVLALLGEEPTREGLRRTPERVAKAWAFLTRGYTQDPREILESAMFEEPYSEMVIVRDIELFSLCEHHMLPFFGKAHVAYIPDGRVVGLSKLPRVVDVFARRLQLQERLTAQVCDLIQSVLRPKGVGIVIEALHMCMSMRGVQKQHATTVTSAVAGVFEAPATRQEFMRLIGAARS